MNLKRVFKGILLSVVFLFSFSVFVFGTEEFLFSASVSDAILKNKNGEETPYQPQQFPKLELQAQSAISVESNIFGSDKIIFDKNKNYQTPIASLTKLMTAIIVLENYNLSQNIQVSQTANLQSSMQKDIKEGDIFSVENLLRITLIESSNKAAFSLAENMGVEKFVNFMNSKAKELDLLNTFFIDPTGLSPQNISTANDLAKLTKYILKNYPKIAEISSTKEFDIPNYGKIYNTNELLGRFPEIICSKTGFTNNAKGCLLLVFSKPQNNSYVINIILGAEDRFAEMKKMIEWQNEVCSISN